MTTTLITGGAGFIGLHMAKHLLDKGESVVLMDNFARGRKDDELTDVLSNPNAMLIEGDLNDAATANSIGEDLDFIVHFAAVVGVKNVLSTPFKVLEQNVALTSGALAIAKHQKGLKRFIFASTSEVVAETLECYGIDIPTPESTNLVISDPGRKRTTYLLSKIYGEAMCQHSGVPFTIVRPHNIYGPRMGMAHVIPELLRKTHDAKSGDHIAVFSPGHTRTFCYVEDAVKIISLLRSSSDAENGTYNLGRQVPEITIRNLTKIIVDAVGRDVVVDDSEDTPGSPARRCPEMSKTTAVTGYEAEVDIEEGVKKTYDWYRRHAFDGG